MIRRALPALAISLACMLLCQAAAPQRAVKRDKGLEYWSAYIPRNLDECFEQLKKKLDPAVLKAIRNGSEDDMVRYHFGLGMTLRNGWGLWRRSRLAEWFNSKGIHHPDDMSGTILTSFWRHLHHQPIGLAAQIKYYEDYWKASAERDNREKARVEAAGKRIRESMIGVELAPDIPSIVKMPTRTTDGLRARSLALFREGVLLTVRKGSSANYTTPAYFLDLSNRSIRPIEVPEIGVMHSAAVVGKTAYFCGKNGSRPVIVAVGADTRSTLPLPRGEGVPRLGVAGKKAMAVYPDAVFVLDQGTWSKVESGPIRLPKAGPPPRLYGNVLLIRAEGQDECDKRLWRIELGDKPKLVGIDEETGLTGSWGPRWESCYSYCVTPAGDLWAALGMGADLMSLVKRSPEGRFQIALMLNNRRFDGDILGGEKPNDGLTISAIVPAADGSLLAAGPSCLYRIADKRITKLVAFRDTAQEIPWDGGKTALQWGWAPSDILELGKHEVIVSGMYGGIYLIRRSGNGRFEMVPLDEKIGKPMRL